MNSSESYQKEVARRRVVAQKIATMMRLDLSLDQCDRLAALIDELANGGPVVTCECGEPLRLVASVETRALAIYNVPSRDGKLDPRDCPNRAGHGVPKTIEWSEVECLIRKHERVVRVLDGGLVVKVDEGSGG